MALAFQIAGESMGRDIRKKIPDTASRPVTRKPAPIPMTLKVVDAAAINSTALAVPRLFLSFQE